MTRTLRLEGELGELFGKVHRNLHIKNVGEAIRYLSVNFKGFREYMEGDKNILYEVWDGEYNCEISPEDFNMSGSKDIKILPHIGGAGAGARIALGAVLMVVGYIFAPVTAGGSLVLSSWGGMMIGMGASLVLGGVIELLSPKSSLTSSTTDSTSSYLFSGAKNDTQQGAGIYVGYGELEVGSQVVSATITTKDWPVSAS